MSDLNDKRTDDTCAWPPPGWRIGGPLTDEQRQKAKEAFLVSFSKYGNVTMACAKAGVARSSVYIWKKDDPQFEQDWATAVETSNDLIRNTIFERSVIGWEEPLVSMGKAVFDKDGNPLSVRKHSDALLQFLAKSRMPDEFRERQTVDTNLNAQVNAQVQSANVVSIDTRSLTLDQIAELKKFALKIKAEGE